MTASLNEVVWPMSSLGEALLALAGAAKLPHSTAQLVAPDGPLSSAWLTAAAQRVGLEAESVEAVYGDVESLLKQSGPALVNCNPKRERGPENPKRERGPENPKRERGPENTKRERGRTLPPTHGSSNETDCESSGAPALADASGYIVALSCFRSQLRIVAPDLSVRMVSIADVCESLCRDIERPHRVEIETLLGDVGISGRAAAKAQAALLRQKLSDTTVGGVWLLRAPGHGEVHWGRWLTLLIGAHLIEQSCTIAAWSLLGWMTLSGRLDSGWLWAWLLLLISIVPFQLLSLVAGGRLSLEFGASLRRRLLGSCLFCAETGAA